VAKHPMRPKSRSSTVATRDRILNAAVERFTRTSYEQTGLRDIAADVGVDVAYVHRCFGSKKRLFVEAVRAAIQPADLLTGPAGDLAGKLANHLLSKRVRRRPGLDIIIRSLSSPEASPVVREFLQNNFISPLAEKLDEAPTGRIALITAFSAGVAIFRNVLRIAPLLEAAGGELESLIANTIGSILAGATSPWRDSTLKELLSEPIITALMDADRVDPKELEAMLRRITAMLTNRFDIASQFGRTIDQYPSMLSGNLSYSRPGSRARAAEDRRRLKPTLGLKAILLSRVRRDGTIHVPKAETSAAKGDRHYRGK
jgi:AcrR family transcriptional regulator